MNRFSCALCALFTVAASGCFGHIELAKAPARDGDIDARAQYAKDHAPVAIEDPAHIPSAPIDVAKDRPALVLANGARVVETHDLVLALGQGTKAARLVADADDERTAAWWFGASGEATLLAGVVLGGYVLRTPLVPLVGLAAGGALVGLGGYHAMIARGDDEGALAAYPADLRAATGIGPNETAVPPLKSTHNEGVALAGDAALFVSCENIGDAGLAYEPIAPTFGAVLDVAPSVVVGDFRFRARAALGLDSSTVPYTGPYGPSPTELAPVGLSDVLLSARIEPTLHLADHDVSLGFELGGLAPLSDVTGGGFSYGGVAARLEGAWHYRPWPVTVHVGVDGTASLSYAGAVLAAQQAPSRFGPRPQDAPSTPSFVPDTCPVDALDDLFGVVCSQHPLTNSPPRYTRTRADVAVDIAPFDARSLDIELGLAATAAWWAPQPASGTDQLGFTNPQTGIALPLYTTTATTLIGFRWSPVDDVAFSSGVAAPLPNLFGAGISFITNGVLAGQPIALYGGARFSL